MYKTDKPIESVTIEINGKQITLPRSELSRQENIEVAIEQYERVRNEIKEVDYERQKLIHAHMSMNAQIQRLARQYVEASYPDFVGTTGKLEEGDEDNKESDND